MSWSCIARPALLLQSHPRLKALPGEALCSSLGIRTEPGALRGGAAGDIQETPQLGEATVARLPGHVASTLSQYSTQLWLFRYLRLAPASGT